MTLVIIGLVLVAYLHLAVALDAQHWQNAFLKRLTGRPLYYMLFVLFSLMLYHLGFEEEQDEVDERMAWDLNVIRIIAGIIIVVGIVVIAPMILFLSFFTDKPVTAFIALSLAAYIYYLWKHGAVERFFNALARRS